MYRAGESSEQGACAARRGELGRMISPSRVRSQLGGDRRAMQSVGHPTARCSRAWRQAIGLLLEDLQRRDAAPRTRRAYRVDLEQFARWAGERGSEPREIDAKARAPLRRSSL